MNWFMAFLHHLFAFLLVAALAYEWLLLRQPLTRESARSLVRTDQLYGACAMLIVFIGGLRVFYFEKGAGYYFHSAPFITKLILFAAVGLLSIYPTVTFLRWRNRLAQQQLPTPTRQQLTRLKYVIQLELIGIAGIVLGAALAAKGIGYFP